MKRTTNRVFGALLAAALLLSLFPGAMAADKLPPAQTITMEEYLALDALKSQEGGIGCYIPFNDGSGTSGVGATEFVAIDDTWAFVLESMGDGISYCAQLYMLDGGHLAAVAPYAEYAFGTGFIQEGLIAGETYVVKISSTSVSRQGANGRYYTAAFPSSGPPPFREYADLDLTTTSPEWWPGILQARCDVIFGSDQKWSIDGMFAIKHADGTYEVLPKFDDLYPDWNLGDICLVKPTEGFADRIIAGATSENRIFEGTVNLTADPATFYSFNSPSGVVVVTVETLPGEQCSITMRNEDDGVDWVFCNLTPGQSLHCATWDDTRYSFRVSSPTNGDAYFVVETI